MSDAFVGAWRVREYVYAPNGALVGTVRQRRLLERAGARVRIVQECVPDEALDGHPMARFAGTHVFEVSVDGALRRYHGPAVVGSAFCVADGAMLGRGVWPDFGYSFTSFAVVCAPGVQLTGGSFGRADEVMARIVGVAVDERDAGDGYPELAAPSSPAEVARTWSGTRAFYRDDGASVAHPITRSYERDGWDEGGEAGPARVRLLPDRLDLRVDGRLQERRLVGFARRFGPALQLEAALAPDAVVDELDVVDAARGHLVALRRVTVGARVVAAEVQRLHPLAEEPR